VRGQFTEEEFRSISPAGTLHFPEPGRALLGVGADGAARALEKILGSGLEIEDVTVREPSLENVFLKLTGRELRD
jgi:hypothetical protein